MYKKQLAHHVFMDFPKWIDVRKAIHWEKVKYERILVHTRKSTLKGKAISDDTIFFESKRKLKKIDG